MEEHHGRLGCDWHGVGRRGHQPAQDLLRDLEAAHQEGRGGILDHLLLLLDGQLRGSDHTAPPCLIIRAAGEQPRLDPRHIGRPTIHARGELRRLHLHLGELARVAHLPRKPSEHPAARPLKDAIDPSLGLPPGGAVKGLRHGTAAKLRNARKGGVELLLDLPIPILQLRHHIRGGARGVAHLHIHILGAEQVAPLAILEGLGKGIELRHIGLRHRGLKAYVKEAVLEVLVDTSGDRDLLPNGKGLDARAEHGPPLKLTSARKAVDRVDQLRRINVIIAVGRGEADAAKEVAIGAPQHHGILRDGIPLHRAAAHQPWSHEAEAHKRVNQGVDPQGVATLQEAVINHGLI